MYARFSELQLRSSFMIHNCSTSDDSPHTFQLLDMYLHMILRNYARFHICLNYFKISCNVCRIVENVHPHCTCNRNASVHVCGNVPRVRLHFDFIFVVLTRGNVTLNNNIVIGPFVRMTLQSRRSCGENRPVCGNM